MYRFNVIHNSVIFITATKYYNSLYSKMTDEKFYGKMRFDPKNIAGILHIYKNLVAEYYIVTGNRDKFVELWK